MGCCWNTHPNGDNMIKVGKLESAKRVRELIHFMLTVSSRRAEILRVYIEKWGIGHKQLDVYIRKAHDQLLAHKERDIQVQKSEALAQIDLIISESMRQKNFKVALHAIKTKMDLQGLAEPAKVTVSQTNIDKLDRVTVIAQLSKIAQDKGIMLEELCKLEGIDLDSYTTGA